MKKFNFDFMSKRRLFIGISVFMVAVSMLLIVFKGFNWGIDFSGGTIIEFKTHQSVSLEDIRTKLNEQNLGSYTLQKYGDEDEYLIKVTEKIEDSTKANEIVKSVDGELRRLEYVGPQMGRELAEKGILAALFSIVAILIYVAARFQMRFAVGGVLALFHDVIITLGMFSLLGKEFTLTVLAAVLTIIGYSLNDTIVVYDRIRENMQNDDDELQEDDNKFAALINKSINDTLRRSLMTSITTMLVLFALLVWGGMSIHDFAFALLFGIVVGVYSSVFVASPMLIGLKRFAPKPKSPEQEVEDFARFNQMSDD